MFHYESLFMDSCQKCQSKDSGPASSGSSPESRHKQYIGNLSKYFAGKYPLRDFQTDDDILKQSYRFLREEQDDLGQAPQDVKMARQYYDKLFREYAICDLSQVTAKKRAIGLRWRTHKEACSGKGQFVCGVTTCKERQGLTSYEIPFKYKEAGNQKHALVKVRVCALCAEKLLTAHDSKANIQRKRRRDESPYADLLL
jgi:protein FRA10AC1